MIHDPLTPLEQIEKRECVTVLYCTSAPPIIPAFCESHRFLQAQWIDFDVFENCTTSSPSTRSLVAREITDVLPGDTVKKIEQAARGLIENDCPAFKITCSSIEVYRVGGVIGSRLVCR